MLILPYHPEWGQQFLQLADILAAALEGLTVEIEHIGSTAVPGLAAKPIIDLDLIYPGTVSLVEIAERLKQLAYFHNGDQGIAEREAFKRALITDPHPVLDQIPHHLYACPIHSAELKRHLQFRDYLRQHPEACLEYAQLKREIAVAARQDRKVYATMKELRAKEFFARHLR